MIKNVTIKNYRTIKDFDSNLSPGINLIVAKNGSGKTNFLESLYFASAGYSFRPIVSFSDVIGEEDEFAKVQIEKDTNSIEYVVSKTKDRLSRKYKLNTKVTSVNKLATKLPFILFAPQSVNLVSGEPQIRRDDIDDFLSFTIAGYSTTSSRFRAMLKNRNALLKQLREEPYRQNELSFWTNEIIELGNKIFQERHKFFSENQSFMFDEALKIFHDFKDFEVKYVPNTENNPNLYLETLRNKFEQNVQKEIIVGKTLYGAHKDDYDLLLNGKNLRYLGSRGQQRIGAFILKVAQYKYMLKYNEIHPVFLLDDIFSELDNEHRTRLSDLLMSLNEQIVITTADINEVPENLKAKALVIDIGSE